LKFDDESFYTQDLEHGTTKFPWKHIVDPQLLLLMMKEFSVFKDAVQYREIIEHASVNYMTVQEYADLHGKKSASSDAFAQMAALQELSKKERSGLSPKTARILPIPEQKLQNKNKTIVGHFDMLFDGFYFV